MSRTVGRSILGLLLAVALAGCTILEPRFAPPESPRDGGLVIVYGELVTPLERWSKVFAGGAKEDVRPLDYGRMVTDAGDSVQGRGLDGGVVVFNPRPGRYRLRTIGYLQRRSTGPYPVAFGVTPAALEQFPALAMDVGPSDVIVVGKVVVRYRDATLTDDFALESLGVAPQPAGERAALAAVLAALDPGSPWRPLLEQRLRALGQ